MHTPHPLLILGIAVGLSGIALFGWQRSSSYLRTGTRLAGEQVQQAIPRGFEIERLATLIADLDQTLHEQEERAIGLEVDRELIAEDLAAERQRASALTAEVRQARRLLADGGEDPARLISHGTRRLSAASITRDATTKAEALVRIRAVIGAREASLGTVDQALAESRALLARAHDQRDTYALRLAELRAQAENVALREELVAHVAIQPAGIDRSAFQEIEASFQRLERELHVHQRELALREGRQARPLELAPASQGEVLERLDAVLAAE